jgi:membrane protein implicated in regulation of membrane protease activity
LSHMANPKRVNRKALKVAMVLLAVGVLLTLVGALINGEWPTGAAAFSPILAVVALLLVWYSQRDRPDGSDG